MNKIFYAFPPILQVMNKNFEKKMLLFVNFSRPEIRVLVKKARRDFSPIGTRTWRGCTESSSSM